MREKQNTAWKTVGHQKAKSSFDTAAKNGRLAHAYLITGPAHVGKTSLAYDFVRKLFCSDKNVNPCGACQSCIRDIRSSANLVMIDEDGEIKIEQVRALKSRLRLSPVGGAYRAAIISNADLMTGEAANALLKILEEPGKDTVIFLISSAPNSLPETIRSRVQTIRCGYSTEEDLDEFLAQSGRLTKKNIYLKYWFRRLGLVSRMINEEAFMEKIEEGAATIDRIRKLNFSETAQHFSELSELGTEEFKWLTSLWQYQIEEELCVRPNNRAVEIADAIIRTSEALNFNANRKLLVDNLMIKVTL